MVPIELARTHVWNALEAGVYQGDEGTRSRPGARSSSYIAVTKKIEPQLCCQRQKPRREGDLLKGSANKAMHPGIPLHHTSLHNHPLCYESRWTQGPDSHVIDFIVQGTRSITCTHPLTPPLYCNSDGSHKASNKQWPKVIEPLNQSISGVCYPHPYHMYLVTPPLPQECLSFFPSAISWMPKLKI